jgi:hypothetical protein
MAAPFFIADIFYDSDDNNNDNVIETFQQQFETQTLIFVGMPIKIRQFSWHQTNANQVWPGTYRLAQYLSDNFAIYNTGKVLELGAATGALSIYLTASPFNFNISTSDIDDEGTVERNISHNFKLNGMF